jgi:hypothetical protein
MRVLALIASAAGDNTPAWFQRVGFIMQRSANHFQKIQPFLKAGALRPCIYGTRQLIFIAFDEQTTFKGFDLF